VSEKTLLSLTETVLPAGSPSDSAGAIA